MGGAGHQGDGGNADYQMLHRSCSLPGKTDRGPERFPASAC
jgi:hypothetical protein